MKKFLFVLAFLAASSKAEVFRKVDPQTGHVTYTNIRPDSPNGSIDSTSPIRDKATQAPVAPSRKERPAPKLVKESSSFPVVSGAVQRERDIDRRTILLDELSSERKALSQAEAKKDLPDNIARHLANIDSLKREIASIK